MFPKRSAFSGAVSSFRRDYSFGELILAVGELTLSLVWAKTLLRVVLAELSFIFADISLNSVSGLSLTNPLIVS